MRLNAPMGDARVRLAGPSLSRTRWGAKKNHIPTPACALCTLFYIPVFLSHRVALFIKGLVEIVPIFHTLSAFARCVPRRHIWALQRPVPSQWVLTRESTRPQIHRFRPQARAGAPPLEVSLPHQRCGCGDGEVSGSGVSEGVCEALSATLSKKGHQPWR